MNPRHLITWLILLSAVVVPCLSVLPAIGEPPAKNPFDLGKDDPFAGKPTHPPVRDERFLQMRTEQVNNTIEVIQIKARQHSAMLQKPDTIPPKYSEPQIASQLKTLIAKNWWLELELKQLKVELLKMQAQRVEKEIAVIESSKDATIAERYKAILQGDDSETPNLQKNVGEPGDEPKSR